jgi:hypothetical protein
MKSSFKTIVIIRSSLTHLNEYLKVQLCTIIRGRTNHRFRGIFVIIRDENGVPSMFERRHNAALQFYKDSVNRSLAADIKLMFHSAQKVQY